MLKHELPKVIPPLPDARTSPIMNSLDDENEFDELIIDEEDSDCCYFNNSYFQHGSRVICGSDRLRCDMGVWIRET